MRVSTGLLVKIIVIAVILAFVFFTVTQREFPNWIGEISKNPETPKLPYYIFRTMLRMIAAYILVVIFGLSYGIIAGTYERPRKVMMPLLDILQSIPVLGYLPAAILFFVNVFPGELGVEIASILLIFTGEAWAVTFGIFGAVRNLPEDLKTVGKAFGLGGVEYYRKFLLPCIFPAFITGSILAWGGGWYFLVACEFMTFGGRLYTLPGVGYYLANAVYVQHSIVSAIFGLIIFILLIFSIDKLVWTPLMDYSEKFKVQTVEHEQSYAQTHSLFVNSFRFVVHTFDDVWEGICTMPIFKKLSHALKPPRIVFNLQVPQINVNPRRMRLRNLLLSIFLFSLVMYFLGLFVAASVQKPLANLELSFQNHPEAYSIPFITVSSILRIFVAYVIALVWTLAAAVIITRSKTLSRLFLPLFDIGQSIPALALFPFIVIVVFKYFGTGELGVEIASVILLLTGTQWYLLFNIIGAIKHIPGDVIEAANSFGIKDWKFVRYVILPAIFPGIVVGSIQAWGGAWNATIVSEYINYGGQIYSVNGLGAFISRATGEWGDPWLITIAIATMSLTIILLNRFVWSYLFGKAERYKFEMT
ncbi:ABC transporter permease subunit [Candidatus Micrarchaeota archaeon]|nr:ABC transporter permease subunit [Candidatus Micrarchaeota archaeon]